MDKRADKDIWLTAAECAERIGLTVRALRLYERYGLVRPKRTQKNWRVYGPGEIARLNEIIALKGLGLSLSAIADLLAGQGADLDRLLTVQHLSLIERQERIERGLKMVGTMRKKFAAGELLTTDELLRLAKETNMSDTAQDTVAWRRYEQARPRTEVKIDPALLADYEGFFLLENGAGVAMNAADGHLKTQIIGQPEVDAFAEAADQFFLKLVPAQIVFTRDEDGAVTGFVLHQGGYEHPARRIGEAQFTAMKTALDARVKNRTPVPDSEAIMRRVIDEHLQGKPDYTRMLPPLAALARQQAEITADLMARYGALKALAFKGVLEEGWDVYEATHENGKLEWAFLLAPDGRFNGLYVRPVL